LDLGDFWSRWFGMNWRGVFFGKALFWSVFSLKSILQPSIWASEAQLEILYLVSPVMMYSL
jgi:hypothetical protein